MHYDFVPLELMAEYAHVDGEICYLLGEEQRKTILKRGSVRIGQSETDLSQVVVDLYTTGIKLDVEYCKQEFDKELAELHTLKTAFLALYMCHYSKSRTELIDLFRKFVLRVPLTDKGNPSFNSTVLESIDHPLPKAILAIRKKEKFIGTYFSTYMTSHCNGIIRPFPKQSGTETGRFSYQSPNLQNVPRHSSLRKCFIPRMEHLFVMIDYDQQEYRLLADIACERSLIKQVLLGKDVHTATAELMEVDRVTAKTINFALLYGAGAGKIADTLKVDISHAKKLISKYFSALPEISKFIQRIPLEVKRKGYIENFMGRRLYVQKEKAYKAVNHLIQSSGADVVKSAMVCLHNYLRDKRSHMVLQVHDEIIFEVHCSEFHIIPHLKEIMESVYKPLHGLSLTCSIGHSYTSWGDKKEGLPDGKETGDSI
jgi:DNA polymerase-1